MVDEAGVLTEGYGMLMVFVVIYTIKSEDVIY
jgi:hypothetical protein